MTTLAIEPMLDPHAQAIRELTKRFQQELASECQCGDEACPGTYMPPPHDYRVVALTLTAGVSICDDLRHRGGRGLDWSNRMLHALSVYAKRSMETLDHDVIEHVETAVRRCVGRPMSEIVDELLETSQDMDVEDVRDDDLRHPVE